ncbi:hypothetical protein L249_3867 [Ophiocordyceps polyrhachis-furcata BCC 54312]|uniref:Uncharacterized protein n=1 Tax=Ophiocordyceps polyrhachis-furcata BCC 54312 TaxID=1330021 RepID=A0A367L616_9HYPO|nr:hypothetical protein L249_3867 [Ophiocordyceps polyrhachis-furcata BCC 54312]
MRQKLFWVNEWFRADGVKQRRELIRRGNGWFVGVYLPQILYVRTVDVNSSSSSSSSSSSEHTHSESAHDPPTGPRPVRPS